MLYITTGIPAADLLSHQSCGSFVFAPTIGVCPRKFLFDPNMTNWLSSLLATKVDPIAQRREELVQNYLKSSFKERLNCYINKPDEFEFYRGYLLEDSFLAIAIILIVVLYVCAIIYSVRRYTEHRNVCNFLLIERLTMVKLANLTRT